MPQVRVASSFIDITGLDDWVRREELGLKMEYHGKHVLLSGDWDKLEYVAMLGEDRANPNEGFEHSGLERMIAKACAKSIRKQLGPKP